MSYNPTSIINEKIEIAFKENRSVLVLPYNRLGDLEAYKLAVALKTDSHLKQLDISNNEITDTGIKEIGRSLKSNTGLVCFNLSNNKFMLDGVKELFKGIKINQSIKELNISYNSWANGTLLSKELVVPFQFNKSLTKLHISHADINDDLFKIICEALELNDTLEYLDVSGNSIECAGDNMNSILEGMCCFVFYLSNRY